MKQKQNNLPMLVESNLMLVKPKEYANIGKSNFLLCTNNEVSNYGKLLVSTMESKV